MTIDLADYIYPAITGGGAIITAVFGWMLKRNFIDRIDKLETKIDALVQVIADMKESNASDHREVVRKIAHIEGKLNID